MSLHRKKLLANRVRILQKRLELQNARIISEVFREFSKEIENKVTKQDLFEIDYSNFIRNLKRVLSKTVINSSSRTTEWCKTLFGWRLEGNVMNRIHSEVINNFNENFAADKITKITNTTRETINNIITRGQSQGLNTDDIAKNIVNSVSNMSMGRARTIAVTETANAVDITTFTTATEAEMSNKTWLHIGGGYEDRESHVALDGVTIKMDEYFNVNGHLALYPHDPNLPVGEIVNCHCICVYE